MDWLLPSEREREREMPTFLGGFTALLAAVTLLLSSELPPLFTVLLPKRSLDVLVKTSRGASILFTVFATLLLMLASSLFHIHKQITAKTTLGNHEMAPRYFDQPVSLLNNHLQDACLTAFCLFLGVVILRLHSHLHEIQCLQLQLPISRKQTEAAEAEHLQAMREQNASKRKTSAEEAELRCLTDMIIDLRLNVERLQIHSNEKEGEIREAKTTVKSLQKQTLDFLLEYDRIVAENANLRRRLSSLDRTKEYLRAAGY